MNRSDPTALGSSLNPTVFTARASLMGGAAVGDKYAEKMLELIKNDESFVETTAPVSEKVRDELYRFSSAYSTSAWTRSRIADKVFDEHRMVTFVDLGCGFNPRGLSFVDHRYVNYIGIDLPAITDKMNAAVRPLMDNPRFAGRIRYCAADVTDRDTLRSFVGGKNPLFIVTEGLMMYLTEKEMQTVIENISGLLAEFDGMWFTGDAVEHVVLRNVLSGFFDKDNVTAKEIIGSNLSEKWQGLLFENSFMTLKEEDQTGFFGRFGLNCRQISAARYMNGLSLPEKIRKAYENTKFLMMTSRSTAQKYRTAAEKSLFCVEPVKTDSGLVLGIHGRLDSLTAPQLIEEYEKQTGGSNNIPLIIDMIDCPYLSSAGIRAILMLFKRTKGIKDGFSLRNIKPEVLDILNTTGFSEFLE
jgi:anti-anti-sigma factor